MIEKSEINNSSVPANGVISVLLQDYFHRGVFRTLIGDKQWSRFESRLDQNVDVTLTLLDKFQIKATFFTLGWIGEKFPALIKRLADEGHEIASAGFWAREISEMSQNQFRDDIRRARHALQEASGKKILGYRCAYRHIQASEWWTMGVLRKEGHLYDASYCPPILGRDSVGSFTGARQVQVNGDSIWEFPISTKSLLGLRLPISGGNYLRQLPHRLMLRFFEEWLEETDVPFVLYFHPWELNDDQPVINAIGPISRVKQYRNLGKLRSLLPAYFERAAFTTIRKYLAIESEIVPRKTESETYVSTSLNTESPSIQGQHSETGVSVIVPCYNEESSLPYLDKALEELTSAAAPQFDMRFVFVDDSSTDRTLSELKVRFGDRSNCMIIHHEVNQGIAKAIASGIAVSDTDIVCSIDADCSYDPLELLHMIPELNGDTDLVTASPYHKEGFVLAVPAWRLFLSKSLSGIYRVLLRHKLATYTSCFRVYRKSSVENLKTWYGDFRGIVELLARLDIAGGQIKEYPTTLQSRIFGYSKMKTLKAIVGHLKLSMSIYSLKIKRRLKNRTQRKAAD